jgi:predicted flap endonuclease-1-like 5' DNA nuclease
MPLIRWVHEGRRRVLGPYVWERANLFRCHVAPADYLEVITNPGFVVVDPDPMKDLEGVGEAEALALEWAGIVTFQDLIEEQAAAIAERGDLVEEQVRDWQDQARAIIQ